MSMNTNTDTDIDVNLGPREMISPEILQRFKFISNVPSKIPFMNFCPQKLIISEHDLARSFEHTNLANESFVEFMNRVTGSEVYEMDCRLFTQLMYYLDMGFFGQAVETNLKFCFGKCDEIANHKCRHYNEYGYMRTNVNELYELHLQGWSGFKTDFGLCLYQSDEWYDPYTFIGLPGNQLSPGIHTIDEWAKLYSTQLIAYDREHFHKYLDEGNAFDELHRMRYRINNLLHSAVESGKINEWVLHFNGMTKLIINK